MMSGMFQEVQMRSANDPPPTRGRRPEQGNAQQGKAARLGNCATTLRLDAEVAYRSRGRAINTVHRPHAEAEDVSGVDDEL